MRLILFLTAYFLLLTPTIALAQSVDILWQGESYAPPFYQGRTLWSSQSMITLVAVPQGLGNPAALNYKWSRNGTVLGNTNGVGKNSLELVDSILSKSQNIKIEIISGEGDVAAESSITITPRSPELLVYEDSPLYGVMFHREVGGNYQLREPEVTFSVFPLFFNIFNNNLTYEWRSNTGETGSEPSVTYRIPEGGVGSALISVDVKNIREILQSGERSFLVEFGNENGN